MEMLGDHMFFQGYKGRSIEKFTTTLSPIMGGGGGRNNKKITESTGEIR